MVIYDLGVYMPFILDRVMSGGGIEESQPLYLRGWLLVNWHTRCSWQLRANQINVYLLTNSDLEHSVLILSIACLVYIISANLHSQ